MNRSSYVLLMFAAGTLSACSLFSGGSRLEVRAKGGQSALRPADIASAQALFRRGEYALAIEAYRQLLRAQPDNADVYNGLAVSYAALGRHDLSSRFFELAMSLDPANAKVRRNYALSLERQGRVEDARVLLARVGDMAVPARASLSQIAERSVSGDTKAQQMAALGPRLSRQSDSDVRLSTAGPEQSVPLGTWANSITVKIIERPAADEDDAPEKTAPETPADAAASEERKLSINAIGGTDGGFARLWTRIRDLDAGG